MRLEHHRTKGPASTPAQRLVELQNALTSVQRERDALEIGVNELAAELNRYQSFGSTSFAGVPMAQIWADLWMWEGVLNSQKFDAVFEIGTYQGGFSTWMYAQCQARDMFFETYDAVEPEREIPGFLRLDVFSKEGQAFVDRRLGAWEPCILFCDGGNKPRELQTFAPLLDREMPGSIIAVHDWGTETHPEDVPEGLEMLWPELCEQLGSMTRWFRKAVEE